MNTKSSLEEAVVLERTFNAPVARVWRALTDVEEMRQWYFDLKEFNHLFDSLAGYSPARGMTWEGGSAEPS